MEFVKKEFYTIEDLLKIVGMLRDKDNGCDWDKAQTHQTIRKNFIEETYEAVDAIDKNDKELLQEELGDVLLQVLLHSQFEKEIGCFDFGQVVNGLSQKLVLRHPHVFKGLDLNGVDEVLNKWEEIKNESHGHNTISQTLNAVPKSFPALMYTQKVQKRVAAGGVKLDTQKEELDNIRNATALIEKQLENGKADENTLAQLLFSTVNLIRQNKCDAEELLGRKALDFVEIFNIFEDLALQKGVEFGTIKSNEFMNLWQQAMELANKKNY